MEGQDDTDKREEDVDMITLPTESQAALSSAQGNGASESTTAARGATTNGASKPASTTDGQSLPIRTGKSLHYVADLARSMLRFSKLIIVFRQTSPRFPNKSKLLKLL